MQQLLKTVRAIQAKVSLKIVCVFVYTLVCTYLCTKPCTHTVPVTYALLEHFMTLTKTFFCLKQKTN